MDLKLRAQELAFQAEVRAFIDAYWPESVRSARSTAIRGEALNGTAPEIRRWINALNEKGWAVPNWPQEWGGADWTPTQKYIWERESAVTDCPQLSTFAVSVVAPALYTWGTQEQKERFLPLIREVRMRWCQGYPELGAGADLATRAEKDGDKYVVNGTKIRSAGAHVADWMLCLVRTNCLSIKQEGISLLLIDMTSEGITVKPIAGRGGSHSVNELDLTNVRVPVQNLVGVENNGWTYVSSELMGGRTSTTGVARSEQQIQHLKQIACETSAGGASLWDDAGFRRRVDELEVELSALAITELRVLAQAEQGGAPGPECWILEIKGAELAQAIAMMQVEAFGYYSLPCPDRRFIDNEGPIGHPGATLAMQGMLYGRAPSIFGASSEIQQHIISKAVLGL